MKFKFLLGYNILLLMCLPVIASDNSVALPQSLWQWLDAAVNFMGLSQQSGNQTITEPVVQQLLEHQLTTQDEQPRFSSEQLVSDKILSALCTDTSANNILLCADDIVVCGNLVVTGTIFCQQCPVTPPPSTGCAQLKIVYGTFTTPAQNAVPAIITCSGDCAEQCNWSVVRTGAPSSTSQFTVTFNPAFLSLPTVVAVPGKAGGGGQVTVDTVTQSTAVFDTNSSPDLIHFIAISCCG